MSPNRKGVDELRDLQAPALVGGKTLVHFKAAGLFKRVDNGVLV